MDGDKEDKDDEDDNSDDDDKEDDDSDGKKDDGKEDVDKVSIVGSTALLHCFNWPLCSPSYVLPTGKSSSSTATFTPSKFCLISCALCKVLLAYHGIAPPPAYFLPTLLSHFHIYTCFFVKFHAQIVVGLKSV